MCVPHMGSANNPKKTRQIIPIDRFKMVFKVVLLMWQWTPLVIIHPPHIIEQFYGDFTRYSIEKAIEGVFIRFSITSGDLRATCMYLIFLTTNNNVIYFLSRNNTCLSFPSIKDCDLHQIFTKLWFFLIFKLSQNHTNGSWVYKSR